MSTRVLPVSASDQQIRKLVVDWSEAISKGGFSEALDMFPSAEPWTAELLQKTIQGYGVPEHDATLRDLLKRHGVEEFRITSLLAVDNHEQFIQRAIEVDRDNLYGLDPQDYLGMVHYNDVPLSGRRSDLTARFHIKKLGVAALTLEFLDIHVM